MIFIAIPFYKNTNFLNETLHSLIRQSSPHWMAVVLDDSIDPAEAHRAEMCVKKINDARIHYQKNVQNIGMANNWNQGLKLGKNSHAIGTTILHADDRLLPFYVESMTRALESHPDTTAFFCKANVIDDKGRATFSFTDFYKKFLLPRAQHGLITLKGLEGIKPLIPGNFIFCPTLCYRNSRITRLFKPELKMVTDFEFTLDLLLHGHQLQGLYSRALFEYRRHSSNTTNLMNQNLERFKEEKNLYLDLAHQLEKKACFQLAKQARKMKIIKKNLLFHIVTSLLTGKFSLTGRYLEFLSKL